MFSTLVPLVWKNTGKSFSSIWLYPHSGSLLPGNQNFFFSVATLYIGFYEMKPTGYFDNPGILKPTRRIYRGRGPGAIIALVMAPAGGPSRLLRPGSLLRPFVSCTRPWGGTCSVRVKARRIWCDSDGEGSKKLTYTWKQGLTELDYIEAINENIKYFYK